MHKYLFCSRFKYVDVVCVFKYVDVMCVFKYVDVMCDREGHIYTRIETKGITFWKCVFFIRGYRMLKK